MRPTHANCDVTCYAVLKQASRHNIPNKHTYVRALPGAGHRTRALSGGSGCSTRDTQPARFPHLEQHERIHDCLLIKRLRAVEVEFCDYLIGCMHYVEGRRVMRAKVAAAGRPRRIGG